LTDSAEATVRAFNDCITARDIDGIARLMTDDYTFIDTAGAIERGKDAGVAAWGGFFARFPDYRNVFATLTASGDLVVATGYSICAEPALDGPALWRARVRDGKVAEWQVDEDNAENRARLGIDAAP
jgi:ketosteroid isomerase-like protein